MDIFFCAALISFSLAYANEERGHRGYIDRNAEDGVVVNVSSLLGPGLRLERLQSYRHQRAPQNGKYPWGTEWSCWRDSTPARSRFCFLDVSYSSECQSVLVQGEFWLTLFLPVSPIQSRQRAEVNCDAVSSTQ